MLNLSLLSVAKVAHKNFRVNFYENGCGIIDAEDNVVGTGNRLSGLYLLPENSGSNHGCFERGVQSGLSAPVAQEARLQVAAERIINDQLVSGIKMSYVWFTNGANVDEQEAGLEHLRVFGYRVYVHKRFTDSLILRRIS